MGAAIIYLACPDVLKSKWSIPLRHAGFHLEEWPDEGCWENDTSETAWRRNQSFYVSDGVTSIGVEGMGMPDEPSPLGTSYLWVWYYGSGYAHACFRELAEAVVRIFLASGCICHRPVPGCRSLYLCPRDLSHNWMELSIPGATTSAATSRQQAPDGTSEQQSRAIDGVIRSGRGSVSMFLGAGYDVVKDQDQPFIALDYKRRPWGSESEKLARRIEHELLLQGTQKVEFRWKG